jgi:DNA-binding CsgD family transcriptional regulator
LSLYLPFRKSLSSIPGFLIIFFRLRNHTRRADKERVVKKNQDRRREPSAQAALTSREREILYWVVEGKRDAEIAAILNLSVRTVEQHVRSCLMKLNVETRTAACAAVWRTKRDAS